LGRPRAPCDDLVRQLGVGWPPRVPQPRQTGRAAAGPSAQHLARPELVRSILDCSNLRRAAHRRTDLRRLNHRLFPCGALEALVVNAPRRCGECPRRGRVAVILTLKAPRQGPAPSYHCPLPMKRTETGTMRT